MNIKYKNKINKINLKCKNKNIKNKINIKININIKNKINFAKQARID